ncbi:concanavalin A-like lectin/glucanase domain-containing protein [Bombardia bombarda]|uniref:Concanavalin A-like lectin/glucanase domain-containing protein n=1 Tax=Bombardia bombarda TaxID=252184 RepID=A0AA39WH05_9PEZI|nr:concanavalin A-like lectin/glucanase domain-containing protein [Bombardia bombarda]
MSFPCPCPWSPCSASQQMSSPAHVPTPVWLAHDGYAVPIYPLYMLFTVSHALLSRHNASSNDYPLFSPLLLSHCWRGTKAPGFNIIWEDTFTGAAGAPPNLDLWFLPQGIHTNNEQQSYTGNNDNLQISGGGTIQFIPRKAPSGAWTSARIETKQSFTPQPGKVTIMEAAIRFGDGSAANKQGIWPAFWMLGEAIHHGTPWPQCGELDIMETVNGIPTAYGTAHCGTNPGGPCNEPIGRSNTVSIPNNDFHTWTIKIDRTNAGNFRDEVITWLRDGQVYNTLTGADLGDEGVWGTLAHSPLFMILNLAVGGDWPGPPNAATTDSYGSMMEVEYVAVMTN